MRASGRGLGRINQRSIGNFMYMSIQCPQLGFGESEGAQCSEIFLKFSFRKYYMKRSLIKMSLIMKVENSVVEPKPRADCGSGCGSDFGSFLFTTDLKKFYIKKLWLLKKFL
jgi:hypothetical protein